MRLRILFLLIGFALSYISCVSTGKETGKLERMEVYKPNDVRVLKLKQIFPKEPRIKVGIGKGRIIRLKTLGGCSLRDSSTLSVNGEFPTLTFKALKSQKPVIYHWVILEDYLDPTLAKAYQLSFPDVKILKLGIYPRYFVALGPFEDFKEALRFKHPNKKAVFSILEKPSSGEIYVEELDKVLKSPVYISCAGYFSYKGNRYKGDMIIMTDYENGLVLINDIDIEDYLRGVIPWEISPSYPEEALKAQAVAARTHAVDVAGIKWYLLKEPYDITDDFTTQVYKGFTDYAIIDSVINETKGIVMMNGERFSIATFFTNCGGVLESGREWGDSLIRPKTDAFIDMKPSLSLLKVKSDTNFACSPSKDLPRILKVGAESFRWEKKVSLTEISESIKKNFGVDVGRIKSLEVLMRSETGRVKEVKVVGSKNSFVVRGDWNIRVALGNLKSSYFTFKRKGNYIYFYGGGWGHGIGSAQV